MRVAKGFAPLAKGFGVALPEGAADDRADLAEVLLPEAAHGRGRSAQAQARSLHRRALVEGNCVPVGGDLHLVEPLLGGPPGPFAAAEVDLDQVRVRSSGEELE